MQRRRIVFVIFDGFQALDLAGPHEAFQYAGTLAGGDCQVLAPAAGPVRSSSGLPVPLVTTHWTQDEQLARQHPGVRVDCDLVLTASKDTAP
nr:hypothetical protein [Streptomyces collinus]